jgi:hypothetical protein
LNTRKIGNENLIIYLNPAPDFIYFNENMECPFIVSIYSINGQLIKKVFIETMDKIDIKELSRGIYLISSQTK